MPDVAELLAGPVHADGRVVRAVVLPDGSAVMQVWDSAARAWAEPDHIPCGWHELPFLPPAPDPAESSGTDAEHFNLDFWETVMQAAAARAAEEGKGPKPYAGIKTDGTEGIGEPAEPEDLFAPPKRPKR